MKGLRLELFVSTLGWTGFVIVGGLACCTSVSAAVLEVPSLDYPTIQSAIAAAVQGVDNVLVHDGTYYENIDFLGKSIVVRSVSGPGVTTIDGSTNGGSVAIFQGLETHAAQLIGFTLTGGTGTHYSGYTWGGGIYIRFGAAPTISNCVIQGNTAEGGAGVSIVNSAPVFLDCLITGNTATTSGGGLRFGGEAAAPSFTRCAINNNTATSGAGVYISVSAQGTFTGCTIRNNTAADHWEGGGFSINSGSLTKILSCLITENTAGVGGGIYVNGSSPNITNSTIAGNSATETNPDFQGGGIYLRWADSPTTGVTNSIIWGNSPNQIQLNDSSIVVTYSAIQGDWVGDGNIDDYPAFTGPHNYHLLDGSPCIDAGDNDAPVLPNVDIDGDDRIIDGNGDQVDIIDMGADEVSSNDESIFSDGFELGNTLAWSGTVS